MTNPLSEQIRDYSKETNSINDAATYSKASTSWATIHDYGDLVLTESSLVVYTYESYSQYRQNTRLKVGSTCYVSGFAADQTLPGWHLLYGTIWLAAGTYDIIMESIDTDNSYPAQVKNFQMGIVKLSDLQGSALAVYTGAISITPTARTTLLGPLAQAVFACQVHARTTGALTTMANASGGDTGNYVGISLDGVRQDWDERNQDNLFTSIAGAAEGKLYCSVSIGTSHSITITKGNVNTVVDISIVCCPWLLAGALADAHIPITLSGISTGSTVYLLIEPLTAQLSKTVVFGKKRAITQGASDYYGTTTGTGSFTASYTFEIQDPNVQYIMMYGLTGCVAVIGVDSR
jgi:hypothetical protein